MMGMPVCGKCDMRISLWDWWGENVDITWVHQPECPRYQGLRRPKVAEPKHLLHNTADVEALPTGAIYRTPRGEVGVVEEFGGERIVQWAGTDLFDVLPRDNAYPFPDQHFPAEVIWSPDV